ncbi:hypothetical protein SAMN05444920_106370 [Nonomuraea solani]|uniref:Superoxide dismutase, Cu-Zn family n=1 Tax=Nonomuraea solani TaxID=1144553 RepID=A0A1H6DUP3_9ACTN|nr:hypothetical protein [Nonomuraea solani]SEG89011.1 hypothetical protein SAMN05444920_106370 [Nonomuraea solani]
MVVKRFLAIVAAALSVLPASAAYAPVPFRVAMSGCPGAITEGTLEWMDERTVKVEGYVGEHTPFPSCVPDSNGFHTITFRGYSGDAVVALKGVARPYGTAGIAFELAASQAIDRTTVHVCYFMLRPISMLVCMAPSEYRPAGFSTR